MNRALGALLALAAALRVALVLWAAERLPPAADGFYYDVLARRLAAGQGYTWRWPDGAVTNAAHYPVGYPAVLGGLYALFGPMPWLGMAFNAALGVLAVWAAHRLLRAHGERCALFGAALVALHPSLLLYTPALMTEAVVGSLLLLTLAVLEPLAAPTPDAVRPHRWVRWSGAAALLALAVLMRPQALALAPVLGALAARGTYRRVVAAVALTAATLVLVTPWTLRNCAVMDRCIWVSANGGWNLQIGAGPGATGAWVPIEQAGLPPECANVHGEGAKDACFGTAAARTIGAAPGRWLGLAPEKLRHTFDYAGAVGAYVAASNWQSLPWWVRAQLDLAELLVQRLVLALALLAGMRAAGAWRSVRFGVGALALIAVLSGFNAWLAYLAFSLLVLLNVRNASRPLVAAGAAVLATAATHAAFFGATRYALVCFPLLAVAAAASLVRSGSVPNA